MATPFDRQIGQFDPNVTLADLQLRKQSDPRVFTDRGMEILLIGFG
jgi:hypothetical protein